MSHFYKYGLVMLLTQINVIAGVVSRQLLSAMGAHDEEN
jgi:hypothetical protein